jgi:hypothetical protein
MTARRRYALWTAGLLVLVISFLFIDSMGLTIWIVPVTGDAMDWRMRYLAGWRSVNCGRVKVRQDAGAATQCALKAQSDGRPFYVVYNIQGIDSLIAGGVVRTPNGRLLALSYDSCPSGCVFSIFQQRVSTTTCPEPYHLYVNPKNRLNCFQPGLSYPNNLMSPNLEPY